MIPIVAITKIKGGNMPKTPCFSIDACADILHVKSDNLYKKCRSVYVLADDLIEEKNENVGVSWGIT